MTYRVFGLTVESEIPLDELISIDNNINENCDVLVKLGKNPEAIDHPLVASTYYQLSKSEILFEIPTLGKFYIKEGSLIQVELFESTDEKKVKVYILGICMGMIMVQKNRIPIHGSGLVHKNRGMIVCGSSGAGKSTLTEALKQHGFDIMSDDLTPLVESDGHVWMKHGYPFQRLCRDVVDHFGYDVNDLERAVAEVEKYKVSNYERFHQADTQLRAIYYLNKSDVEAVTISEVKGPAKLPILVDNLYAYWLIKQIGLDPSLIKQLMSIANQVKVYTITRPLKGMTTDDQINKILSTL